MTVAEFIILNGKKSHKVSFLNDDRVLLDGKEYRANVKMMDNDRCSLILDNVVYRIDLVKLEEGEAGVELEVIVKGRTLRLRPQDARTQLLQSITKAHAPSGDQTTVRAPMPGLVGRILAVPGTHLGAGGGILILEAMKMENEITCPSAATVKEIKVSPGQSVDKNQILAILSID
ncbi:MAG: biotin/lipoyl-containing protein [Bacteroidota bacterium]